MEGPCPRFCHLTAAKMEEKRWNTYFCPEPCSNEHKCIAKGDVFLVDLPEGEEVPLSEINDLEISLHALTGLNYANSMMLQVTGCIALAFVLLLR